jgi:hypothetical protein
MAAPEDGTIRSDFARWFIDHDEVDEAARVLTPGDQLELGRSDYQNLVAALGRRGLSASYDAPRVVIEAPAERELGATARKPPARIAPAEPSKTTAKKTA